MTTMTAVAMQAEKAASRKKSDKAVQRDTIITFANADEMRTVFARLGINPYRTYYRTRYFDVKFNEEVDLTTAEQLRKHGHDIREEQTSYEDSSWEEIEVIKDKFKLMGVSIDIYTYSFRIRTYDLTGRKHKATVMKLLRPIRKLGFDPKHDCQSEVTDYAC